jgi:hypothetical protein
MWWQHREVGFEFECLGKFEFIFEIASGYESENWGRGGFFNGKHSGKKSRVSVLLMLLSCIIVLVDDVTCEEIALDNPALSLPGRIPFEFERLP